MIVSSTPFSFFSKQNRKKAEQKTNGNWKPGNGNQTKPLTIFLDYYLMSKWCDVFTPPLAAIVLPLTVNFVLTNQTYAAIHFISARLPVLVDSWVLTGKKKSKVKLGKKPFQFLTPSQKPVVSVYIRILSWKLKTIHMMMITMMMLIMMRWSGTNINNDQTKLIVNRNGKQTGAPK